VIPGRRKPKPVKPSPTVNRKALEMWSGLVLRDGRLLGDVALPWQWNLAFWGFDPDAEPNRVETRPRGGSKTTDIAGLLAVRMLCVLPPGERCYSYASDRDQARLVLEAISGFAARTPALAGALTINNWTVSTRAGTVLEVESSDAASAWGKSPADVMCDEFFNWDGTTKQRKLWEAISTSMGKVPGARLLLASTSGDPGSWTRGTYDAARKSKRWSVQDVPGPLPWVSKEFLADQKLEHPESVYNRVHLNIWATPEDRLTTVDHLDQCVTLPGPLDPQPDTRYVMGCDFGLTKDRTVCAVMHAEKLRDADGRNVTQHYVLDRLGVWKNTRAQQQNFDELEEWIVAQARKYHARVYCDPWNGPAVAQRVRQRGISMDLVPFTSTSNDHMATGLHVAIRDGRLAIPPDPELLEELANVRLVEKNGQFKLEHDPDKHNDRASAISLAIMMLTQIQPQGGRPIIWTDEEMAAHKTSVAATLGNGSVAVPGFPSRVTVAPAGFAMPASVLRFDEDFEDDKANGRTSGPAIEAPAHGSTKRSPFAP
jgi:phage terminase large subunit-like protein